MSDYALPAGLKLIHFQMRIMPLTKQYASVYSGQTQVTDMLSENWVAQLDIAPGGPNDRALGLTIEAFFDRLKGAANRVVLSNLRVKANQGTMRGSPVLTSAVAQLSNILPITTTVGATALPGDMLSCGGQLFRVMSPATADGSGHMSVEVAPRVRASAGLASGAAVTWNQPTALFRLSSANPSVDWIPDGYTVTSIELREDVS